MSAFSERVEREDEQDRQVALAQSAMFKAQNAWRMQDMQLPLVKCVVCDDQGCSHCPRVSP